MFRVSGLGGVHNVTGRNLYISSSVVPKGFVYNRTD